MMMMKIIIIIIIIEQTALRDAKMKDNGAAPNDAKLKKSNKMQQYADIIYC